MAIIGDIVLVIASLTLAHYIRFESWSATIEQSLVDILPGIIVLKILIFAAAGLYMRIWRYAGISELLRIVMAAFFGSLASGVFAWIYLGDYMSVSVFAIDFLLMLFLISSSRFSWKGLRRLFSLPGTGEENVLLYGAGDAGWMALTEIRQNTNLNLNPIGFLDDSPYKQKGKLQGLDVLGSIDSLQSVCESYRIDQVLICIRELSDEKKEKIKKICSEEGLKCKEFMPVFDDLHKDQPDTDEVDYSYRQ